MADTVATISLNNGQNGLQALCVANGVIGTYLFLNKTKTPVATDLTEVIPSRDMVINDIIAGPATGKIRLELDGYPTDKVADFAAHGATNSARPKLNWVLPRGKKARFEIVATLPA